MVETIGQLFFNTVRTFPKDNLMMHKVDGVYASISTDEVKESVQDLALGIRDLGLEPGDKLVILAENSPHWVMTDLATLSQGGISVPIYTSLVPEQIKYIIDDSDAKIVVCSSPELWKNVEAIQADLDKVKHYITFFDDPPEGVHSLKQVKAKGREISRKHPDLFEALVAGVNSGDVASIIYTSGTTGLPKGVMLMHGNLISNVRAVTEIIDFSKKDTVLSFLPLSHILERMVTFTYLYKGCSIAYAESLDTVGENLTEVKPQIMVSVPRVFEKIYAKVIDNVLASSSLKKKIFFWAVDVGKAWGRLNLEKRSIPKSLQRKRNLAHKLVFSKVIEKTGGAVRFFVSGGAPLSRDIAEFFYALGLVVLEGYGLTETSPVIAVNTFENLKFGTVGQPIPGVQVRIAEDGEILTKGPHVMKGYYKLEKATEEALRDGWFHTGDIGHLDDDGFLVITDRKKDLIVTAGGKNVAPQPIENILKTNPYIGNAVVIGDKRKFISALIVPDFDKLEEYAKAQGIAFASLSDLVKNDRIVGFIENEVSRSTPSLASYEKIKKVALLDRDFEIEQNEITPTLKVKRNIIEKKYADLISSLYGD